MKRGERYLTPDGDVLEVLRVSLNLSWCDVKVTQPHGATWKKRVPLFDGFFKFEAYLCHHPSANGVDYKALDDPQKRWRCTMCNAIFRREVPLTVLKFSPS